MTPTRLAFAVVTTVVAAVAYGAGYVLGEGRGEQVGQHTARWREERDNKEKAR